MLRIIQRYSPWNTWIKPYCSHIVIISWEMCIRFTPCRQLLWCHVVVVCLRTFENTCMRQTNILRWNTYVKLREEASIYRMVSFLSPVVSNVLYEYPKLSFWIKWNPDCEKIVKFNNQSNNWLTSCGYDFHINYWCDYEANWKFDPTLKLTNLQFLWRDC